MSIDERLASTSFPLPAIREVNMAKHTSAISLGLGELKDFTIDNKITEAFQSCFKNGGGNYTQNAGLPLLRSAVAVNQQNIDGFCYTQEHVAVTIGVQNAMYATLKTLAKLGAKRVLIPEINFGIYKKIPADFSMQVVTYSLTSSFGIDIEALSSILKADDVVIINSPSNPTGRVFTHSENIELANLLKSKLSEGYVIADEIYGKLVYDNVPFFSFSKYFERTIILDGISKSAAAAGLRVGWVIAKNKKLIAAITSNNALIISCPPTANQYAAIPVVRGETQTTIDAYNKQLKSHRDFVAAEFQKANIPYILPMGGFYIFPKISELIHLAVKEFCLISAQKQDGVVLIPGEAFGANDYVRISLASMQIKEGISRFIKALKENS